MKTTKLILFLFFCFSLKAIAEEPAWELVSMNPPRGSVLSIDVGSNNEIFMGSEGGLLVSYNNGGTWQKLLEGNIIRMCFQSKTLFLRKDDSYSSLFCVSTDYGLTWSKIINGCNWISKDNFQVLLTMIEMDSSGKLNRNFYLCRDTNIAWISNLPSSLIEYSIAAKNYLKDSMIFQSLYNLNGSTYLAASFNLGVNWSKIKLPNNFSIHDLDFGKDNEIFPLQIMGSFLVMILEKLGLNCGYQDWMCILYYL